MSGAAGTCSGLAAAASARSASSCAGGAGGSRGRQSAAGGSGGSSPPPAAEHTPSCRRGSAASGSESVSQVESQSSTVVGSLKLTPLSRLPMGPEAAEAEGWERPRAAYGCGMAGRGGGGRGCSPARPQPTDTRGAELEPPGSPQEPRAQPWRRHRAHPGGGTAGSGGAALARSGRAVLQGTAGAAPPSRCGQFTWRRRPRCPRRLVRRASGCGCSSRGVGMAAAPEQWSGEEMFGDRSGRATCSVQAPAVR